MTSVMALSIIAEREKKNLEWNWVLPRAKITVFCFFLICFLFQLVFQLSI